ncbi:hypothetical protein BU16DRAFT_304005 [Lophium mytilinum]|uniref:Arabinanase/levansucrase/invertase n=1 Tax=Lophium mytilinum TaxID=390894 RepID=A0A6A6R380_9PEZI|nr:hypothetical protein BU16DRAFT_304005 [Lophium mytilinum]
MDSLSEVVALSSFLTVAFRDSPNSPLSLVSSGPKAAKEQQICDSPPACFNYIFTTFGGENGKDERTLDVYTSADGIHFAPYVMGAYVPENSLLRDPSIILHDDGWYYVVHTTSWNGDDFALIRSKDLKTWDHVVTIKIKLTDEDLKVEDNKPRVAQSWAPEFFRDPQTNNIHIIISLRLPSPIEPKPDFEMKTNFAPYIFTATSRDLKSWTPGKQLDVIGLTPADSYIDMFVIYNGSDKATPYHGFMKNEVEKHIEHLAAASVEGPWEFVQKGDFAGWGIKEGPAVVQKPGGGWRMWADDYHGHVMYADSNDLWNWTKMVDMPDGVSRKVRHGTILRQV